MSFIIPLSVKKPVLCTANCYNETVIKAIIFDCFGVLAEDGWTPFKRKYIEGNPEVALAVKLLGKDVDSGKRSFEDMIRETAHLTNVPESVVRIAIERQVPNEELFAYIKAELKPSYKIGLLSNASYNVVDLLFSSEQKQLLDAHVLSYETGLVKPQPQIYERIAEGLEVRPDECVMVDDQSRHCAGAISVGMQAILYKDFAQYRIEMQKLIQQAQ
jgi:HAD superfamily hydrolase (TIGR01509 family)